jgi:hypothetical protein
MWMGDREPTLLTMGRCHDGECYLDVVEGSLVKPAEIYTVGSPISRMLCDYSDTRRLGFKLKPGIEKI